MWNKIVDEPKIDGDCFDELIDCRLEKTKQVACSVVISVRILYLLQQNETDIILESVPKKCNSSPSTYR